MKAVVAAFNQEKALVGAFSVITNLRMELFEPVIQAAVLREMPDMSKHDPYGSGGWRKAEPASAPSIAAEPQLNLGLPAKRLVP